MTIRYRVDLEDTTGSTVASFLGTGDGFLSLNFTKTISDKGSYQFILSGFDSRKDLLKDDYLLRLWLDDRANNIEWTNVFTGIHKTFTDSLSSNGRRTYTSFGPSLEEILDKAYILYASGSSEATKSGASSTVMYEYVAENVGASATVANGRFVAHTNPITNAPDLAQGPTWDGAMAYKNLLVALKSIRENSIENDDQIDFRVNYLGNYAFQFEAGSIGVDRTVTGLDPNTGLNAAGNQPVIFSALIGNLESFVKSKARYNEANVVAALGQGLGANRSVAIASNTTSILVSPIAQRELVTNAVQVAAANTDGLADTALAKLQERIAEERFTTVPQRQQLILFRDYDVGDFITVEDEEGNRFNRQVEQARVRVSPGTTGLIARENLRLSE